MTSPHLNLNGLIVPYTVAGEGPPAVLVHGHASSQAIWKRMVRDYLGQHYRCYMLDLPGCAAATKPSLAWFTLENYTCIIEQVCDQLGLKEILLAGHSMGGLLCLNLALTRPELIKNLILIAPAVEGSFMAYLDPLLALERLICQPWAERLLAFFNAHPWLAVPIGTHWYARRSMVLTDSFKQARADFAQCPLATLMGNLRVVRRANLRIQLPYLRSPTLIITGDTDRVVPPSQARLLAASVPQAKLVVIPQAGHLPFDEQPEKFDAAIQAYLEIKK